MAEDGKASFWARHANGIATVTIVFLLAYVAVRNILRAEHKPFWFDELCTWIVARQPSVPAIWNALMRSVDGQAPGYYLVERIADRIIGNEQIAFRVPSILAICCLVWFLFVWLKKRYGPTVAFFASLIPLLSVLHVIYAVEARPYALIAGCLALALVCYQRVPALPWVILLGLALLLAQTFHYYTVVMMTPFLAAEAFCAWKKRVIRWPVWAAFSVAILPLLVCWPILSRFKAYYGQHFWSKPSLLGTLASYGWLFGAQVKQKELFAWTNFPSFLIMAVSLAAAAAVITRAFREDFDKEPFAGEGILTGGFLLLPFVFFIATTLAHGGDTARYVLPAILGIVLAAGYGLSRLSRRSLLFVGAGICLCLVLQETAFWISYYESHLLHFAEQRPAEQLVSSAGHGDLPVMVSDADDYLQLAHYAPPEWNKRFVSVVDPAAAVTYGRSDTADRELMALRQVAPLRVIEFSKFRNEVPQFLLYSSPRPENNPDWWVSRLTTDGYTVKRLTSDGHNTVYLVESSRETD